MKKLLLILLLLAGCQTPHKALERFCADYGKQVPKVVYKWELLAPAACVRGDVIYVNTRRLHEYKECEGTILKHEAGHVFGLTHCENKDCLMYYKTHDIPIHISDKKLCTECEGKIWR